MSSLLIGIVDYGAGNYASVRSCIKNLGYRCRPVTQQEDLKGINLLLLPGVGAYASAMEGLITTGLDDVIRQWGNDNKPLIGICLGMQLLAECSYEHGLTRGLELIPGCVKALDNPAWHIGWNRIEMSASHQDFLALSLGKDFYFNHSYEFLSPPEYVYATARLNRPIVSVVKRGNICGFQFHPEKSQKAGEEILKSTIEELTHA